MAVTDFKYATQSDLEHYYSSYSQLDAKRQIFGWVTTSNLHQSHNSGLVTVLYVNGDEVTATENTDEPNANGEWRYVEAQDVIQYYDDTITASDVVMEGGIDNSTYFDQMLVRASLKLNSIIDHRYPTPIPKHPLYDANSTTISAAPEYDSIIVEATCYICVATLLRSKGLHDEADKYSSYTSNSEGTGLLDKLNSGAYKLAYEVDSGDSKGAVRAGSGNGGNMDIVETGGAYTGEPYDNILITCTTGGAYGVAIVKVAYFGSDKLQGSEKTNIKVTGGLQSIHSGWYARFQGSTMNSGDTWEVGLYSETREISNAESGAIQLTRRGYGI